MLFSHFPINDSSCYLNTTVYLAVLLQFTFWEYCRRKLKVRRFIYQVMVDCKNSITSNLLDIEPRVSQRRAKIAGISSFFHYYFENNRFIVLQTLAPEGYQYTSSTGIPVWVPKKRAKENIPFFTLIFSVRGYISSI